MLSKVPTAMTADTVWGRAEGYYPVLIYERNYRMVTAFGPYERAGFNPYRTEIPLLVRT